SVRGQQLVAEDEPTTLDSAALVGWRYGDQYILANQQKLCTATVSDGGTCATLTSASPIPFGADSAGLWMIENAGFGGGQAFLAVTLTTPGPMLGIDVPAGFQAPSPARVEWDTGAALLGPGKLVL